VTADKFRALALELPETIEGAHMGHPDFRVRGKIFASLGPKEAWGMIKLSPDEQAKFVRAAAGSFEPFNGAWGLRGATKICLEEAKVAVVRKALVAAWRQYAPKRVIEYFDKN
jgi:hypothetical protein